MEKNEKSLKIKSFERNEKRSKIKNQKNREFLKQDAHFQVFIQYQKSKFLKKYV